MKRAASPITLALASRPAWIRRHRARPLAAFGCGLALSLSLACASTWPSASDVATRQDLLARELIASPAEATAESLVVRLAFDADADLDLYVTDPAQETVYFGNSPSGGGGRLLADQRCDAPTPRVETVVFARRTRGTVRVGVDAPEGCRDDVRAVPFVVDLRAGDQHVQQRGVAIPGRFEVIVLEVPVEGVAAPPPSAP
jgi:hypothetical protein